MWWRRGDSIEGLQATFDTFGEGHFDVLHLSGHAAITVEGPRFVMEDDIGRREDASAADIADAVGHRWPPLVFLSGCRTGGASDEGDVASMAEALVIAGAPSVLGWALPVGDHAASRLAAELYRGLAGGSGRDRAVANARRLLFVEANRFWHLLRLYAAGHRWARWSPRPPPPGARSCGFGRSPSCSSIRPAR